MKILITGGGGLLGQYLNIELSKNSDILTLYHNNSGNCREFNNSRIDITNKQEIGKLFKDFNPEIVIHNAAVSHPKMTAQKDPKTVYRINVEATRYISELCNYY